MRYNSIDTISFTDINGVKKPVKDTRPLQELDTSIVIDVEQGMIIDEVISRREYYGDNAEDLSYLIIDHNAEKIVENDFDLDKLKKLKIPKLDNI